MKTSSLLKRVRTRLKGVADPSRAVAMRAYMKSAMPFHGVPMPKVRAICKELFAPLEFESFAAFNDEVRALWDGATHREEWYAALALLRSRQGRRFMTSEALDLDEYLITQGSWWDVVDDVATHQLLPVLTSERAATVKVLRAWSRGRHLWLRRAAIIAQIGARASTDVELLFEFIEPAVDEKEFFLRKAIGWALRSLAPYRPAAVENWLDAHAERVAGLTRREAEKGLDPRRRKAR